MTLFESFEYLWNPFILQLCLLFWSPLVFSSGDPSFLSRCQMLFSSLPSVLVQPGDYPSKFAGGRGRLSERFFWGSLSLARFFSNPFRKCFAPSVRALFVVLALFWLALTFCFPSCAGHFRVGFRIAPLLCWLLRVAVVVHCRASRDRRARRRFIFGN